MIGPSVKITGKRNGPGFNYRNRPDTLVRIPMENLPGFSLVSDFNTGHGFAKFGSSPGIYTEDSTDGYRNNHCLKITTDGTATVTDTRKATTSTNAASKILILAVKFANTAQITSFDVTVGTSGLTNRRRFSSLEGNQGNKWFHSGEWQLITIPWQNGTDTGTPDRNNITDYQIRAASNGFGPMDYSLGAIGWMNTSPLRVTVSADDGYAVNYTTMYPYWVTKGIKATLYVPVDNLGGNNRLTLAQCQEMVASGLVEIGYHGPGNDQRVYTTQELKNIIEADLRYWNNANIPIKTGCYPGGEDDENVSGELIRNIYAQYFGGSRMIFQGQSETVPAPDSMRLRVSNYVTNSISTVTVSNSLNNSVSFGGWHHQIYHELVTSNADTTTKYLISDFMANMNIINSMTMSCNTVSEVLGI